MDKCAQAKPYKDPKCNSCGWNYGWYRFVHYNCGWMGNPHIEYMWDFRGIVYSRALWWLSISNQIKFVA